MSRSLIDETGHHYGQLTVIKSIKHPGQKTKWLCQCSCGNTIECTGSELREGRRTSCGKRCNYIKDETGKTYGFLTVLRKDPTPNSSFADKSVHWICKCNNCGNIKSISGRSLRNGDTKSCGCIKSAGETLISKILKELGYNFSQEFTFSDLISPTSKLKMRFDFAIFDDNNTLLGLIEYHGEQHEKQVAYFGNKLEQIKLRDELKRKYCVQNNIPLITFTHIKGKLPDEEALKENIKEYLEEIK